MKDKVVVELDRLLTSRALSPVAHSEWAMPTCQLRKKMVQPGFVGMES